MDTAIEMSLKYRNTVRLLQMLSEEELDAIQSVAKVFLSDRMIDNPYSAKTKEALFSEIDEGIQQSNKGLYEDAESVEAELIEELAI